MTARTKSRIFRKALKIALATFAACILIFALWLITFLNAKPAITVNYLEQYNQLSKPENYNEQDNAASPYQAAFESYVQMPEELDRALAAFYSDPKWHPAWYNGPRWPEDLDPELLKALKEWLTSNRQAFEYARKAATKPYYWLPQTAAEDSLTRMIIPNLNDFGHLARAMMLQAFMDAGQGYFRNAFDGLQRTRSLAKHLSGKRSLIEQTVAWNIFYDTFHSTLVILSNTNPHVEELARFQHFVEDPANYVAPLDFSSEELGTLDYVQHLFTDNGKGNGRLIIDDFCAIFYPYHPPARRQLMSVGQYGASANPSNWLNHKSQQAALLWKCIRNDDRKTTVNKVQQFYSLLSELESQTPWQQKADIKAQAELKALLNEDENIFLATLCRGLPPVLGRSCRQQCEQSALITILALARHKSEKSEYPDTLDSLVNSGYLKSSPMDPYNDGPLVYRKVDSEFTLYSVGADFKDDGGKHVSWSSNKDGDYVFWPVPKIAATVEDTKELRWKANTTDALL